MRAVILPTNRNRSKSTGAQAGMPANFRQGFTDRSEQARTPALPGLLLKRAGKDASGPRAPLDRVIKVKRIRTTMITIPCRFLLAAIVFSVSATIARAQQSPHMNSGYIPHRVYKSGDKRFSDFEAMLAEIARADVAFVGEQH